MERVLGIDLETYSGFDLSNGSAAYAEHESTGVHLAVLKLATRNETLERAVWIPGDPFPDWAEYHIRHGGLVLAFNKGFESNMIRYHLSWRHGWPIPKVEQWRDPSAAASVLSLPASLAGIGSVLGLKLQKDEEGNALMKSVAYSKKDEDGRWVPPVLTPEVFDRLLLYCERDVDAMIEAWWRVGQAATQDEREVQIEDHRINDRGVLLDLKLADAMRKMALARAEQIVGETFHATGDLLFGVSNVHDLKKWLTENKVTLPRVKRKKKAADGKVTFTSTETIGREAIEELLDLPGIPTHVRKVLELRAESGRLTSLSKLVRLTECVNEDQRARWMLRYAGAHTGRWTSKVLQVHNFARPSKAFRKVIDAFRACVLRGDLPGAAAIWPVLEGLSMLLRCLIIAPPGYDLIGGDYSAIEARVVAWLAGQDDVVAMFASGEDVYTADALRVGSSNRDFGKVQRLGLGFGMSGAKFLTTAMKAGVAITPKEALTTVKTWRKNNPKIVQFWRDLGQAFRIAMDKPGSLGLPVGNYLVVFGSKECVRIKLPSGRMLHYWRPRIRTVEREIETITEAGEVVLETIELQEIQYYRPKGGAMVIESTYGGGLAENVTQATAREIIAAALLRLRGHPRYSTVLHVHDSVTAEVRKGQGAIEEFERIMAAPPAWPSPPMKVEGYRASYFKG